MHFFIEHNKISSNPEPFGPVAGSETTKYNTGNIFELNADAKAFAVMDGEIVVIPNTNLGFVNVILKPKKTLEIPFTGVRYFIYKGIIKSNYITGSAIASSTSPAQPVKDIHNTYTNMVTDFGSSNVIAPISDDIGYNTSKVTNGSIIEELFCGKLDVSSCSVKEGDCLGIFQKTTGNTLHAGFEIVLEEGGTLNTTTISRPFVVGDFNGIQNTIEITSGWTNYEKKIIRENILNYIDPAAFYGIHTKVGFDAFPAINGTLIDYLSLINNFANKNRVYLDIRNENGYSLNFYGNYGDASDKQLKINDTVSTNLVDRNYGYHEWPVFSFEPPSSNPNSHIKFRLHKGDNSDPLIYIVHGEQYIRSVGFLDKDIDSNGWIDETSMFIPQFQASGKAAWYIKLYMYRQSFSDTSLNTVFKTENYFDNIFGPIDTPFICDPNDPFKVLHFNDPKYIRGTLKEKEFGFVAESGVAFDDDINSSYSDRIVFFSKSKRVYKESTNFFTANNSTNIEIGLRNSFFKQIYNAGLSLNVEKVYDGTDPVSILVLENNSANPPRCENLLMLGITSSELNTLKGISGFKLNHKRFIRLTEDTTTSIAGVTKYKVSVHGISIINEENTDISPSQNDVYVYSKDGLVFTSKNFADEIPLPTLYQRNYEEDLGTILKRDKSLPSYEITDYSKTDNYIVVNSIDPYYYMSIGAEIKVSDSTSNNGYYTMKDTNLSGNSTIIEVNEQIEDDLIKDGFVNILYFNYEDNFISLDRLGEINSIKCFREIVNNFNLGVSEVVNDSNAKTQLSVLVNEYASKLWKRGVDIVQHNSLSNPDDRPLYWARNAMEVILKSHPFLLQSPVSLELLISSFEEKSRNYTGVDFNVNTNALYASALQSNPAIKKIVITGFDPFSLDEFKYGKTYHNILQSNPSGCCALAMHNTITDNGEGFIQTMIFPVRYKDFDGFDSKFSGQGFGIIEDVVGSLLDEVDMVVTLSQADFNQYHIDVFATNTRMGMPDNNGCRRFDDSKAIPNPSEETYKTTLPIEFTQFPSDAIYFGEYWETKANFPDIDKKKSCDLTNFPTTKVYWGPGGNYLSNEIFYRVSRLREEWIGANLVDKATGHYHIAKLQAKGIDFSSTETNKLIEKVKVSINKGVTGL